MNNNNEGCGRIRLDDGRMKRNSEVIPKNMPLGLIGLCDSENAFLGEEYVGKRDADDESLQKGHYPRIYYDGLPWTMSIVLLVLWEGDAARRLGIGEIRSDEWARTRESEEMIHLI